MSAYSPQNSGEGDNWDDDSSGGESLGGSFSYSSSRTLSYRSRSESFDSDSSFESEEDSDNKESDPGPLNSLPFRQQSVQFDAHRDYRQEHRSRDGNDVGSWSAQKRARPASDGFESDSRRLDTCGRSDRRTNSRDSRNNGQSREDSWTNDSSSADRPSAKKNDNWLKALEPASSRTCEGGINVAIRRFDHCHQFFIDRLSALKGDELVVEGPLTLKLFDPISLCKLETPCRGHLCQHMEAFELCTYQRLNKSELEDPEIVEMPKCPICESEIPASCLIIDSLILRLLKATNSREVELSLGDCPSNDHSNENDVIITERAVFWSNPEEIQTNQERVEISIGSDGEDDCVVVETKAAPSRANRLQPVKDLATVEFEQPFVKTHRTYIPGDYFKSLEDERKELKTQQMRLTIMLTVLNSGSRNVIQGMGIREGLINAFLSKRPFWAIDKVGIKKRIMEIQGMNKGTAEYLMKKLEKITDKVLDLNSRSKRPTRNWSSLGLNSVLPSSGMYASPMQPHQMATNSQAWSHCLPAVGGEVNSSCWNIVGGAGAGAGAAGRQSHSTYWSSSASQWSDDWKATLRARKTGASTGGRREEQSYSSDPSPMMARRSAEHPILLNLGSSRNGYIHPGQCAYSFYPPAAGPTRIPQFSMNATGNANGEGVGMASSGLSAPHPLPFQGAVLTFGEQNVNVFMQPQGWNRMSRGGESDGLDPQAGYTRDVPRTNTASSGLADPSWPQGSGVVHRDLEAAWGGAARVPVEQSRVPNPAVKSVERESFNMQDEAESNFSSLWNPTSSDDLLRDTLQFDSGEDVF